MIIAKVRALVGRAPRLVVSDRRKHLSCLQQMLADVPSAMYVGESTRASESARMRRTRRRLFTTMMGEGLDLPFLDTLVMVTPRKSLEQIIGRIRKKEERRSR